MVRLKKNEYSRGKQFMDAVIMRLLDLPPGINGLTVKDDNGDYNIYINARISDSQRVRAFRHETEHIKLGHFYCAASADSLESMIREQGRHYSDSLPVNRLPSMVWNRTIAVLTGFRSSAHKIDKPRPPK